VAGTIAAATVMVLTVAPVRAVARVAPGPAADAGTLEGEQDIRQLRAEAEILASKLATTADAQEQQRLVRELQALQRLLEQGGRPASGSRRVRAIDRALYEAAEEGDFEGVKDMVGAGANPSATIHGDGNPLIGAAKSGHAEIINYLLDQGADPNGIVEGDGSPLIAAAKFGRIEQVQMLVQRGANVNLAVDGDENPLMNAAEQGHLAMVRFLVENGADIHTRIWNPHGRGRNDSDGEWRTALSQATKNGHKEVAAYLQSLGARN
jgi:hypothetical protein